MDNLNFITVNEILFDCLTLTPNHKELLIKRGLTENEISNLNYKSLPLKKREIVKLVETKVKTLEGTPGFWRENDGDWMLAGARGLVIPVRNKRGRIVAIKIRPDCPKDEASKYVYLSSNPGTKSDKAQGKGYPNGTKAKPATHFPIGYKDQEIIRITEGEIKADIATICGDIYTISIPGVNLWRNTVEELKELKVKPKKVLLAFDADKSREHSIYSDRPFEVAQRLVEFYKALTSEFEGLQVLIEDWPTEAGKGIDDVLVNSNEDQIKILSEEETNLFCNKVLEKGNAGDWVYLIQVKRFVNFKTGQELDHVQYMAKFLDKNPRQDPVALALKNPAFTKIDYPIYEPKQSRMFHDGKFSYFNLWTPPPIKAVEGKPPNIFLEHAKLIFHDEQERKAALDWLAYCLQKQGEKIHYALVIQGAQGTGKSYFGYLMRKLLGDSNVSFPSNDDLHEIYTGWQKSCSLAVIEEIMARGRLELMNKLKPAITQPIVSIREHYKPAYSQPNKFNLLLFTNYNDALILDEDDRRYLIIGSKAKPMDQSYYKRLWAETDAALPQIANWFMTRDLTEFEPKGHAPVTTGRQEMIEATMSPVELWIKQGIEDETWPFNSDLVVISKLLECLPDHCKRFKPSVQILGKIISKYGGVQLGQLHSSTYGRLRVWAIRRAATWESASVEARRDEIERHAGAAQPGGNPHLDSKVM